MCAVVCEMSLSSPLAGIESERGARVVLGSPSSNSQSLEVRPCPALACPLSDGSRVRPYRSPTLWSRCLWASLHGASAPRREARSSWKDWVMHPFFLSSTGSCPVLSVPTVQMLCSGTGGGGEVPFPEHPLAGTDVRGNGGGAGQMGGGQAGVVGCASKTYGSRR